MEHHPVQGSITGIGLVAKIDIPNRLSSRNNIGHSYIGQK
jgi:hypothetical protein